jgi:hypothetical protein
MKKLMFSMVCLLLSANLLQAQTESQIEVQTKAQAVAQSPVYAHAAPEAQTTTDQEQNNDDSGRSKTFSKTFSAGAADKLSLSNQYGNITIKNWDRPEVKADIQIVAYSNNDSDAQKLLDEVRIDAGKTGDQIAFSTKIGNEHGNFGSGSRNGRKWRREVKVNYVVYMPSAIALTVSQQYGNVTMADLSGPLTAKVQYGNFKAGNLSNLSNNISVQYGNTDVLQINRATIRQQYGTGLTLGTVGQLILDAQYTKVHIQTVKRAANTIKIQYGELEIGSIENLILKAQYTGVSIGNFAGEGGFNVQYNNLSIGPLSARCKKLVVDAQYVNIDVNFADNFNATYNLRTSYSNFNHGNSVSAKLVGDDDNSNSKNYTGKIGNGSGAYLQLKSTYGSVDFK